MMIRWCALFLWLGWRVWAVGPEVLYLSWMRDPTTTMVVQWHTDQAGASSTVAVRKASETAWKEVKGLERQLTGNAIWVHTVELTGLRPGTEYAFRVDGESEVYRFRTMPQTLSHKVRFAVGGDIDDRDSVYQEMSRVVAKEDPDFVVLGGDIAYTLGTSRGKELDRQGARWQTFLKAWKQNMVTSDGRLIPMLVLVGNHDVERGRADPRQKTELFYEVFAFPTWYEAYRQLVFGDYLSWIFLDTNHTWPVESQTAWLAKALVQPTPWKMVAYHVAAFPAYYPYRSPTSQEIREQWVPLFQEHKVDVVFENHNHCYKRSRPLEGVLYLGDGSWGVPPRPPHSELYLAKATQQNVAFVVTLEEGKCTITPLTRGGELIEQPIVLIQQSRKKQR
jgi:hypothetical protein